jgi:signal peptidase I
LTSLPEDKAGDDLSLGPYLPGPQPDTTEASPAEEAKSTSWKGARSVVGEVVETVILTLAIFFLIQLLVRNFRVVGTSMEPNLHNGQYLIIDKVSYRLSDPQLGDVVVFEPPNRPGEDYVKRIIGLPGQMVEVRNDQVLVDGQPLIEPYTVRPAAYTMDARRVGPDEYFVLGDNRNSSSDSHTWGMVPRDKIVGRALVCYWPPSEWGIISRTAPTSATTLATWLASLQK